MIAADALLDVGACLALTAVLFSLVSVTLVYGDRAIRVFDCLFVTALGFILASLVVRLVQ